MSGSTTVTLCVVAGCGTADAELDDEAVPAD
jgi:hypothetical protein